MNAEKTNAWLSLTANIGVVVGLGVVVFEINQNTAMMQSQINQSRTDTAVSEQQAVYNSDYIPALIVKIDNGKSLSEEESFRFAAYFRSFNRNLDNQFWQYNQGYLGENTPRGIKGAARNVIGRNSLRLRFWDEQKFSYSTEYVSFVEAAIADMR